MALTKVDSGLLNQLASANMPTGSVLQVVQTVISSTPSTTSGSATDLGLNVSITPKSATSKILVTVNGYYGGAQTANEYFYLQRNSTEIGGNAYYNIARIGQDAQAEYMTHNFTINYLDSPATTSAITYYCKFATNYSTLYLNRPLNQGGFTNVSTSTITVMEIAA